MPTGRQTPSERQRSCVAADAGVATVCDGAGLRAAGAGRGGGAARIDCKQPAQVLVVMK